MIYLVVVEPNGKEVHMKWDGHDSLDTAKKEFTEMRTLSFNSGIRPMDGYVYEADKPEYGNVAVDLDVAAFSKYAGDWAKRQVIRK
jgi:hypothetical protein